MGYPVHHSLSPVMHNAAIAHLGVDYVYLPFPIAPERLSTALEGLAAIGVQGFSVTIPHKQTILPLLTEVSAVAQAIGAVNTVYLTEQGWVGTNTDVDGFVAPLQQMHPSWNDKTALILGNGGAARAVVAGCSQLGLRQVQVVGRNPEKLQKFYQSWQRSPIAVNLSVHDWSALPHLLPQAALVVNTTPVGMYPHSDASPLTELELEALVPQTIAYDLIYTPRPTQFLHQAQPRGAIVVDGLEMLVQQGARALQQWLQQPAPLEVMRRSVLEWLEAKS